MKKTALFLIIIIALLYILSEFIGDRIIRGALERNISDILDREVIIKKLKINYMNGDAEINEVKIKNKEFDGNLLLLKKAYLKLNTSTIFKNNIQIDSVLIDGINLNYFFNLKYTTINDNVKSLEKTLRAGSGKSTSKKFFIIKKLNAKNITLSVNSNELDISKEISLKNLEFENIGNTSNSKDYKAVLREFVEQTIKTVKNKILSGNFQNKIKNIDKSTVEEKIKKELDRNKKKIKNKLKNNLNKVLGINE